MYVLWHSTYTIVLCTLAKKREPSYYNYNERLWWLKKFISYFNRKRHLYLYTRMYIQVSKYTQLPIYSLYMITRTFGKVDRGAGWRVRMPGWNDRSHSIRPSIKLHEQLSSAHGETGDRTRYLLQFHRSIHAQHVKCIIL